MKHGFTLMEIIIGVLIATIITLSLYQLFIQIFRGTVIISKVIEVDSPIIPLYNQLSKDISGMFVPFNTLRQFEKKKEKGEIKKEEKKSKIDKQEVANQEIKLDSIFYLESKDAQNIILSFITTGGLQILESDGSLKPQPYVRRVAYILEKDPEYPETSRLIYRYQSSGLDLNKIKEQKFLPSYVLFQGIKNFKIELTFFELVKDKEKTKEQEPVSKTISISKWNENEMFEKYGILIPAFVAIKGTYIDPGNKTEYDFSFDFYVPSYSLTFKDIEEEMAKEEKREVDRSKKVMNDLNKFLEEKFFKGNKINQTPSEGKSK